MRIRFVRGRELQRGRAALMRRPLLYCLNPERNPGLVAGELRDITPDPGPVEGPAADSSARPHGSAVKIRAWSPGRGLPEPTDPALVLTEFPDAGGEEIYFRLPDVEAARPDELFAPGAISQIR